MDGDTMIHPILMEVLKHGFELKVRMTPEENLEFILDGFYKSDSITLRTHSITTLIAHARYNETTNINSFDDIVRLNYYWWDCSKDRFDGWNTPGGKWVEHFKRLGLK